MIQSYEVTPQFSQSRLSDQFSVTFTRYPNYYQARADLKELVVLVLEYLAEFAQLSNLTLAESLAFNYKSKLLAVY
jgi:hypothetical protein